MPNVPYAKMAETVRKNEQDRINRVKEWADWGLTPHTEKEIEAYIIAKVNTPSGRNDWVPGEEIAWSYLCGTSVMSEKFIEKLLYLSSNIAYPTPKHIKQKYINIACMLIQMVDREDQVSFAEKVLALLDKDDPDDVTFAQGITNWLCGRFGESTRNKSMVRDRLDWYAIRTGQAYTTAFYEKWQDQLKSAVFEDSYVDNPNIKQKVPIKKGGARKSYTKANRDLPEGYRRGGLKK